MSGFSRRWFLHASGLAFLALAVRRLAALGAPRPRDDVPWKVQQVLKQLFGDRPVQDGHVQLDVPTEIGRASCRERMEISGGDVAIRKRQANRRRGGCID